MRRSVDPLKSCEYCCNADPGGTFFNIDFHEAVRKHDTQHTQTKSSLVTSVARSQGRLYRPFKSEQHQPAALSNMFCCYCLARSIPQYPRPLHRPYLLGFPKLGSTITFMLEVFDPDRSLRPCWIYSRVPRSLKHISTAPGNDTQSC